MGNVKPLFIKRTAQDLIDMYPDRLGKDFEVNKKFISQVDPKSTKTLRNKIAGVIVALIKKQEHFEELGAE